MRFLHHLAADYTHTVTECRIERLTFRLLPLIVAVPAWAVFANLGSAQ